mgnify:CR=1 FL=1
MKKMLFSIKGILGAMAALLVVISGLVASYKTAPPADISLGAIPGNEVNGDTFIIGGLDLAKNEQALTATSSALCAFQNPFAATTTIQGVSIQVTRGVLGANTLDISTSSTRVGSSTPALVFARSVASLSAASIVWQPNSATSTPGATAGQNDPIGRGVLSGIVQATGESNYVLGPNAWLTVRLATSSAETGGSSDGVSGSFASPFQGSCTFELKKL